MKKLLKKLTWEEIYPAFFAIVSAALIHTFTKVTSISDEFIKILEGVITFSSIMVGFIAALLGILFSIRDTELINHLFEHCDNRKRCLIFFRNPIISGLLIVIVSCLLFLDEQIPNITLPIYNISISSVKLLFTMWCVLCVYFVLSSYRIIDIIMLIIFKDPQATQKEPSSKMLSNEEVEELKKECSNYWNKNSQET